MIEVFCDGSITGSHWAKKDQKATTLPHAWSGWWARFEEGHVIQWRSVDIGEAPYMSANVAEYMAVRSALKWLSTTPWVNQVVLIHSDSQVVINQLTGKCHCYDPKLLVLRDHCLKLARLFPYTKFKWIQREQNKEADTLSKALQVLGRQPTWEEVLKGFTAKEKKAAALRTSSRWQNLT